MANLLSTKVLSIYTSIDLTWECLYYHTLSNTEIFSFSQVCHPTVFFSFHCILICIFGITARLNILLICVSSVCISFVLLSLRVFLFTIEKFIWHICYKILIYIYIFLLICYSWQTFQVKLKTQHRWVSSYSYLYNNHPKDIADLSF